MLRAASPGLRRAFSCFPAVAEPLPGDGLVLGCGSNVVDLFFRVKSMPRPGDKGYFADPKVLSGSVVGGELLLPGSLARVECHRPRRCSGSDRNGAAPPSEATRPGLARAAAPTLAWPSRPTLLGMRPGGGVEAAAD